MGSEMCIRDRVKPLLRAPIVLPLQPELPGRHEVRRRLLLVVPIEPRRSEHPVELQLDSVALVGEELRRHHLRKRLPVDPWLAPLVHIL